VQRSLISPFFVSYFLFIPVYIPVYIFLVIILILFFYAPVHRSLLPPYFVYFFLSFPQSRSGKVQEGTEARQPPISLVDEQESVAVDTVMAGYVGAPAAVADYEPPGLPPSKAAARGGSPTGASGGTADWSSAGIKISIGDHQAGPAPPLSLCVELCVLCLA
jgi:hypothetical protein